MTLHDLGVPAFRGENALIGNLGLFLREVDRGRIKPGSVLIVESIDRISRQGIDEGYEIIKKLLKAGIIIVTLSPEREFDVEATKSLTKGAFEIQFILERAAEESERKADRLGQAWGEKQKNAKTGLVLTRCVPAWLKVVGVLPKIGNRQDYSEAKYIIRPEAAKAVKYIYQLEWTQGFGIYPITRRLNAEGVPPIGTAKHWCHSYVAKVLNSLAVIGEHQPQEYVGKKIQKTEHKKPMRPAIPNFYPAILSETEWVLARDAIKYRRTFRGRTGAKVTSLFSGLLWDAATGGKLHVHMCGSIDYIAAYKTRLGTGEGTGARFPHGIFEEEVLRESRRGRRSPTSYRPRPKAGIDETVELAGKLARVEAQLATLQASLRVEDKNIPTLVDSVRNLENDRRKLANELDDAKASSVTTGRGVRRGPDGARSTGQRDRRLRGPDPRQGGDPQHR